MRCVDPSTPQTQFAIEDEISSERSEGLRHAGQPVAPFGAVPGVQADPLANFRDQTSIAIELQLMNPAWPLRWGSAEDGKAGIEEAGTQGGHTSDLAPCRRALQC